MIASTRARAPTQNERRSNDEPIFERDPARIVERPGRALDSTTRAFFEQRFDFDFSHVRIHTDQSAARATQGLGVPAFTVGQHIALGAGRTDLGSPRNRALLTHEVAHTIQQRAAAPPENRCSLRTPRRSTQSEEIEAREAARALPSGGSRVSTPRGELAIACAPAEHELHDDEQFGDAIAAFNKNNSSLGADVLSKIRSGIVKLTAKSKTYEVGFSLFNFYSKYRNTLRKMTPDEETKAKKVDRLAETSPGVVFTTTTLRSDVLGYGDQQLATLLLHEFAHVNDVSGDIAGGGSYQEGHAYGVEYFFAEQSGDATRMAKIQGTVSDGDILGFSKAATLAKFQEDFKVSLAMLTALRDVVVHGTSAYLPFPALTAEHAEVLEERIVTDFQSPSKELKTYMTYVKAHLTAFKLPAL